MSPKGEHQFVVGVPDEASKVKEVSGAMPVDTLLVAYADAEGKSKTSLVFIPKGTKSVFMLQQKISGINVATSASDWFSKSLLQYIRTHDLSIESIESEEGVEQM